jgi:hypothetical protein
MVPALELTEEEVLERLKKILKGVSVVLHIVPKYRADNPPPIVSCFTSASTFLHIFSLLVLSVFISLTYLFVVGYLQDLGRNFVDLIPSESNIAGWGLVRTPLDCLQLVSLRSTQLFLWFLRRTRPIC